jgi:hypothetical protein
LKQTEEEESGAAPPLSSLLKKIKEPLQKS